MDESIRAIQKELQQRSHNLDRLTATMQAKEVGSSGNRAQRFLLPQLPAANNVVKVSGIQKPKTSSNPLSKRGRSLALEAEISLREALDQDSKLSKSQKMSFCFELLERLAGDTGAIGSVIMQLSERLREFTFSTQVTSLEGKRTSKLEVDTFGESGYSSEELTRFNVERISYCELYESLKRSPESEALRAGLLTLKEKCSLLEQKLTQRNEEAFATRELVLQRERALAKQSEAIAQLESTQDVINKNRVKLESLRVQEIEELKAEIDQLKGVNAHNEELIKKLAVFNRANNDSDSVNSGEVFGGSFGGEPGPTLVGESQVFSYDVQTGLALQHQFGEIVSQTLEDYETSVYQCCYANAKINETASRKSQRAPSARASVQQRVQQEQELENIKSKFNLQISKLLREEDLLKRHINSMLPLLDSSRAKETTVQRTGDVVLKRYGVTVHFSLDDGDNFYPLPNVDYCHKCRAETVVCPHQAVSNGQLKVPVPAKATHLMFSLPKLGAVKESTTGVNNGSLTSKEDCGEAEMLDSHERFKLAKNKRRAANSKGLSAYWLLSRDHFLCHEGQPPIAPRIFGLEKVMLVINEVLSFRFAEELCIVDQVSLPDSPEKQTPSKVGCFADSFYRYLQTKYNSRSLGNRVAFELLSSLRPLESLHPLIRLFVDHMTGEKVGLLRYCHMANLYYESLSNEMDTAACRSATDAMYPRRDSEARQQVELDQLSFSSGVLNLDGMRQHLHNSIAESCEPNQKLFCRLFRHVADLLAPAADNEAAEATANGSAGDANTLIPFDAFDQAITKVLRSVPSNARQAFYQMAEFETVRRSILLAAEHEDEEHSYMDLASSARSKEQAPTVSKTADLLTTDYFAASGFDRLISKQWQSVVLFGLPISTCAEVACTLAMYQLYKNDFVPQDWGLFPWEIPPEQAAADSSRSATLQLIDQINVSQNSEASSISRREIVEPPPPETPLPTIVGTDMEPPLQIEELPEFRIVSKP